MPVRPRVGRFAVGAAALLAVVCLATAARPLRDRYRRRQLGDALERLTAAAAVRGIPTSRFSAAPGPVTSRRLRAAVINTDADFEAAADEVIAAASAFPPEERRRLTAYAHLIRGKVSVAVQELGESVRDQRGQAWCWSDLAAARYEAVVAGDPDIALLSALTDVDHALKLDRLDRGALFNRALIVERMGLVDLATSAWRRFLNVDHVSDWAVVAREHLAALTAARPDSAVVRRSLLAAVDRGDFAAVLQIVRSSHQDARAWGEVLVLGEWAKAFGTDPRAARRWLDVARVVGAALRHATDESMLSDAVAVIDAATPERAADLAAAHRFYVEGRFSLNRRELAKAERLLREAELRFNGGRSPMSQVAAYHLASAAIESGRVGEAAAVLPGILERAAPSHRALRAQVQWNVAVCAGRQSQWDDAIAAATDSTEIFRQLGETGNGGGAENVLAELYDYVGQSEQAWEHRIEAFRMSSAAKNTLRLRVLLGGGARAEFRLKHWDSALSLLTLEAEAARAAADVALTADVMVRTSRAMAHLHDVESARAAIANGRAATQSMDRALAARVTAELDGAEAVLGRDTNPRHSIELLTSAIDYYGHSEGAIFLPELYLERGRAFNAVSDTASAERDFRAGIDELEAERRNAQDFEARASVLDLGEELFDECIRLLTPQKEQQKERFDEAFLLVERAHARALLDQIGDVTAASARVVGVEELRGRLGEGTAVVEFYLLPEKLVVFRVDGNGLHAWTKDVREEDLARSCEALAKTINGRENAAALYDQMFGDVDLSHVSGLVVVPNGVLQRVPFAALFDRKERRYLVEKVTLSVAPSASIFVANARRERLLAVRPPTSIFVVGNPSVRTMPGDKPLPDLEGAEKEAHTVAGLYKESKLLVQKEATKKRFAASAPAYDVIHFAGHALSDEVQPANSRLLLAPDGNASGVMQAGEIARLKLPHVRLVVLAACSTMSGRTRDLEGMPSIARSFLAAGAPNVVATLWDIEDTQSGPFFTTLHRAVKDGVPPAAAVREAQLDMLRKGKPASVWAPYEVFGGGR